MSSAGTALTLAVIARIPPSGVAAFQAYEARVLPLLAAHGGVLDRRLQNTEGTFELHIVRFPTREHFASYRADPQRGAHASMLASSQATLDVIELQDISTVGPSAAGPAAGGRDTTHRLR